MKTYAFKALVALCIFATGCQTSSLVYSSSDNHIPTSAPMLTDSPGRNGQIAAASVFRVICPKKELGGTAFLHKSGKVITAEHIVRGCKPEDVVLITSRGKTIRVTKLITDTDRDLALLTPRSNLGGTALPVTAETQFTIGSQVSVWGFPTGYNSGAPLLSVGYLAGQDDVQTPTGKRRRRWVVNAAINLGNSGGPLVHVESGAVIGVVSSKLAPLPPHIKSALNALKKQKSGWTFPRIKTDGSTEQVTQAQIIEDVLQHLRSQTQLVIGHSVMSGDLVKFLRTNGLEP